MLKYFNNLKWPKSFTQKKFKPIFCALKKKVLWYFIMLKAFIDPDKGVIMHHMHEVSFALHDSACTVTQTTASLPSHTDTLSVKFSGVLLWQEGLAIKTNFRLGNA